MLRSTRRAVLGAIAAAPVTVTLASASKAAPLRVDTAGWDKALEAYLSARDATMADYMGGALRVVYDRHDVECRALCRKYGAPDASLIKNEKGQSRFKASIERVFAAERDHERAFSDRQTAALNRLMETPAPNLAALRQKVWVAEGEQMEDVNGVSMLGIIANDLAGISGKEA